MKKYFILLTLCVSVLSGSEFYIYNIDNKCQAVFPDKPHIGTFGSYMFNDKSKGIHYQAVQNKFPGNFVVKKSEKRKFDSAIKKQMESFGYKILNFNSKVNGKTFTIEYEAINNMQKSFEYSIEVFKGKNSCKWFVSTGKTSNKQEVKNIFNRFKNNTKFR